MSAQDDNKITSDFVDLLNDAWWFETCCCYGCGCVECKVCMEGQTKICCFQGFQTSGEEVCGPTGCFRESGKTCCMTKHAMFPPDKVRIACCNVFCVGEAPGQADEMARRDSDALDESFMAKAFWLQYCCCSGCGCTSSCDPLCQGQSKFCCLFSKYFTTEFCGPRGFYNSHSRMCCIANYTACPPNITPGIGCCNQICCGDNRKDFARSAPAQMQMTLAGPAAHGAAPGGPQLAQGFLNSLWAEYVLGQENGVGNFLQYHPECAQMYDGFENTVRNSPDRAGTIRGFAMQWGLPPPQ